MAWSIGSSGQIRITEYSEPETWSQSKRELAPHPNRRLPMWNQPDLRANKEVHRLCIREREAQQEMRKPPPGFFRVIVTSGYPQAGMNTVVVPKYAAFKQQRSGVPPSCNAYTLSLEPNGGQRTDQERDKESHKHLYEVPRWKGLGSLFFAKEMVSII